MNYNNFIAKQREITQVKTLKNTKEALEYAIELRHNETLLKQAIQAKEDLRARARDLMNNGQENEGMGLVYGQISLLGEAIREAVKKDII